MSDTSTPLIPARDAAAVFVGGTAGCPPAGSAISTSRSDSSSADNPSRSASSSSEKPKSSSVNPVSPSPVPPRSSAAGKAGSGGGAYGPSNDATWSCPASGSSPTTAGYLALASTCDANRLATAAATGEPPQISGSRPTRSSARDLAGLTNDSLLGRHWCETSSMAAAAAS